MPTVLTRGLVLLAALLLVAGCLGTRPDQQTGYRDTSVPMAIISRGGADALHGLWHVRAAFPGNDHIRKLSFNTRSTSEATLDIMRATCAQGDTCEMAGETWQAAPLAHNRWKLSQADSDEPFEMWVIWIDDGFRTAAIGSPDSDMAFILDRKSKGGADRMTAARDVLEFNGYNISALKMR